MQIKTYIAAIAAAATLGVAGAASAKTIVSGGEARITLTADLDALALGAKRWDPNSQGQAEYYNYVRSSPGHKYKYLRRNRTTGQIEEREWTASERSGSTYISPTAAKLKLASSTLYLYAKDADGNEVKAFAPKVWIAPQRRREDGFNAFTPELRNINFVPTSDPLVWKDYKNPNNTYTLTQAQVNFLTEAEDDLRLCCAHTLGNLEIDTAAMTIDGTIDGVSNDIRDPNNSFYLFDMVMKDSTSGIYDLVLTKEMAEYLNYGFSGAGFQDPTAFLANWAGPAGGLNFAKGDVIGTISYSYNTEVVPLPAGLPLLLGGLGVMGFVGHRRRKQATA